MILSESCESIHNDVVSLHSSTCARARHYLVDNCYRPDHICLEDPTTEIRKTLLVGLGNLSNLLPFLEVATNDRPGSRPLLRHPGFAFWQDVTLAAERACEDFKRQALHIRRLLMLLIHLTMFAPMHATPLRVFLPRIL